jgi:hypothetical protein
MNFIFIAGIVCLGIALILFVIYLILDRGTGRRLRKQLKREYEAKE